VSARNRELANLVVVGILTGLGLAAATAQPATAVERPGQASPGQAGHTLRANTCGDHE